MADIKQIQLPDGTSYNLRDTSKVPVAMGSTEANKTVITNAAGSVTTRKLVDGYTVVQSLPTTNIDQNAVYLISQEYDGGGDTPAPGVTYTLSTDVNDNIVLCGSNGSTSSVDVKSIIDDVINDVLGVAY